MSVLVSLSNCAGMGRCDGQWTCLYYADAVGKRVGVVRNREHSVVYSRKSGSSHGDENALHDDWKMLSLLLI